MKTIKEFTINRGTISKGFKKETYLLKEDVLGLLKKLKYPNRDGISDDNFRKLKISIEKNEQNRQSLKETKNMKTKKIMYIMKITKSKDILPVGSISTKLFGIPMPKGWVSCNNQKIRDKNSLLYGSVTPHLNSRKKEKKVSLIKRILRKIFSK